MLEVVGIVVGSIGAVTGIGALILSAQANAVARDAARTAKTQQQDSIRQEARELLNAIEVSLERHHQVERVGARFTEDAIAQLRDQRSALEALHGRLARQEESRGLATLCSTLDQLHTRAQEESTARRHNRNVEAAAACVALKDLHLAATSDILRARRELDAGTRGEA